MSQTVFSGIEELVQRMDQAVLRQGIGNVVASVKTGLCELICEERVALPDELIAPQQECYARRLIYRSPDHGYEVIAMTWGPGQGTPLHDHAGIWCVDGVLQGRVLVTQYDLVESDEEGYRFVKQDTVEAGFGMAGALIPPFEYHTIHNSLPDRPSVTIHVYGGTMDCCTIFEPVGDGWYRKVEKDLAYHT